MVTMLESLVWHHNLVPIAIARFIEFTPVIRKKVFNPYLIEKATESAVGVLTRVSRPRFLITAPHVMEELLHEGDQIICLAKYSPPVIASENESKGG